MVVFFKFLHKTIRKTNTTTKMLTTENYDTTLKDYWCLLVDLNTIRTWWDMHFNFKIMCKSPKGSWVTRRMTDLHLNIKLKWFLLYFNPSFILTGKTSCISSEKTRAMNTSYLGIQHHRAKGKAVRKARWPLQLPETIPLTFHTQSWW